MPFRRNFPVDRLDSPSLPHAWEGQEKGLQLDSVFLTIQSQLFRISFLSVVIARRNKPQIYRADCCSHKCSFEGSDKKKYGSVSHTLKITGRKEVHGTLLVERGRADQGLLTARVVVVI